MAYVNRDNPNCANCNKSGLAILPVRYAVVPKNAGAELPASLGNKVTNIALKEHKYALRTLRKGYLYLYYEKHARGRHIKWEVYSASDGGTLWKQISINAINEVSEVLCSRKGHLIPASVITIDTPEKCGRVWMAFSEHIWSDETFALYEHDIKLRDRRMQTFAPAIWIKQHGYRHGLEATEANLNQIVEYKTGFALSALGGTDVKTISQPDGSFNKDVLSHRSSVHQVTVRRDDKARLAEMMKAAGERSNGPPHAPLIIALWDSVGITHELNGFRNDAAGWIKKYSDEREREIGAAVSIHGAKKALEEHAEASVETIADIGVFHWSAAQTQARMQVYDAGNSPNAVDRARLLELCTRWERDAVLRAPAHLASQRSLSTAMPEPVWRQNMSGIDRRIDEATKPDVKTRTSLVQQRDDRAQAWSKNAVAEAWPKYEALIDRSELDSFMKSYHTFLNEATAIIDSRAEDVVAWLRSSALQDALTEFHLSSLSDGIAFEAIVGTIVMGITSSPAGETYINELIEEAKCSERNLIWRAIAFNQSDARQELDEALSHISSAKNRNFTEATLAAAGDCTKYFAKLAQLVSKALSLHNAMQKPNAIRPPTGGQEKILLTIGGLFMRPFVKKGADTLSSWLVHSLILVRTGADCGKVMSLLLAEAKFSKSDRADTLLLMTIGSKMAKAEESASRKLLNKKWTELIRDAEIAKPPTDEKLPGGFNESREMRFAIVATIMQIIYFSKIYSELDENPKNDRLRAEVWAAGMSLGSGMADICALGIKFVNTFGDAALTYQGLKLGGGVLSVGAAWMNFHNDITVGRLRNAEGDRNIIWIYYIKAGADGAVGFFSGLNALSYTRPAFEMAARKFPDSLLGRAAATVARKSAALLGKIVLRRAILIFGGIECTLAMLAIDLLIWRFNDDDLQIWCKRCAFGKVKSNRVLNAASQKSSFDDALREVI